jgi:hypothetical protein
MKLQRRFEPLGRESLHERHMRAIGSVQGAMAVGPTYVGGKSKKQQDNDPGRKTINCSGPGCPNVVESTRASLPEGWYTVQGGPAPDATPAHFCDSVCLTGWAATQVAGPDAIGDDDESEG